MMDAILTKRPNASKKDHMSFDYSKLKMTRSIEHKLVDSDGEVKTIEYLQGPLLGKGGFAK
jgi:hypothetical protein